MTNDHRDRPWDEALCLRLADELGGCALCGGTRTRLGPAGHWRTEPVCETCLCDVSPELALILGATSALRLFAATDPVDAPEAFEVCAEMMWQIAKRYETVMAEEWGSEASFLVDPGGVAGTGETAALLATARVTFDRLAAAAWHRLTTPEDSDDAWR